MTKEQEKVFEKLFSEIETIRSFAASRLNATEARAWDDVYSIIDDVYCACTYGTTEKDSINVSYSIRKKIKEQYTNALGLWCSGQYLETLEQWHDYILYNY